MSEIQNSNENESNMSEDSNPFALSIAFIVKVIMGAGNHHPNGRAKIPGNNVTGHPPITKDPGKLNIPATIFPVFEVTSHKGAITKIHPIRTVIGVITVVTITE